MRQGTGAPSRGRADEAPIGYVRHLFTAAEAERVLGIPAATVRSWAKRERIWSFGLDERNRPMYDRDHLLALHTRRVAA